MISYRSDIDGLRAIAVSSVVFYHAVPAAMPGGFVGVDVFFVISGYLITKLIVNDIQRGRFSVASFYVRRTKRIFPALFVVLFTTLALGWFLLTPFELKSLGRTMAATAGFVSNFAFWQDTGYFDAAAETKPLLHTWSLAVEEQFYVLWPLTLLLLHGRWYARQWLLVTIAASFLVSLFLTYRHQPTAFFLLPPRAWELFIGAALALNALPAIPDRLRNGAALVGFGLIVAAVTLIDRSSLFPGWYALAPCVGAALLIAAGERGGHVVSRWILSRRPVVFVGLISYSLYLWHWPLLTLTRLTRRGTLEPSDALAVVAVATVLSVLTWRFIETPLRAKGATPAARPVLLRYAALSVVALVAGLVVFRADGFISAASPEMQRAEFARYDINPKSGACLRWQAMTGPLPSGPCLINGDRFETKVVIWGDSHADALTPGIAEVATERGYATHQLTMAGCPPLADAHVRGPGNDYSPCSVFNQQVMSYVLSDPTVAAVVLSARWPIYTEGSRFGDDPGPLTFLVDDVDREWSQVASRRVFIRALEGTVRAIRETGRSVIVLGTVPALGVDVPSCLARNHMPFSGVVSCNAASTEVLQRLEFADKTIERLTSGYSAVCNYLPKKALCPGPECLATLDSTILYANDDHLTVAGAAFLGKHLEFDCLKPVPVTERGATSPPRLGSPKR